MTDPGGQAVGSRRRFVWRWVGWLQFLHARSWARGCRPAEVWIAHRRASHNGGRAHGCGALQTGRARCVAGLSAAASGVVGLALVTASAQTMDLSGPWRTRADPEDRGIAEGWFAGEFSDRVSLPRPPESGVSWYARDVEVPGWWQGERIELFVERCEGTSRLWVDGHPVGACANRWTAHVYELTPVLAAGPHRLVLRVDSRDSAVDLTQAASSATSTRVGRWGGLSGRIELRATPKVRIASVQVVPDLGRSVARVAVNLENAWNAAGPVGLTLEAETLNTRKRHAVPSRRYDVALGFGTNVVDLEFPMGEGVRTWSQSDPALYRLRVSLGGVLQDRGIQHQTVVVFGMRQAESREGRLHLNGRPIPSPHAVDFDLAQPRVDSTPESDGWRRHWKSYRKRGVEVVRWGAGCPSEAALAVADELGLLLALDFRPRSDARVAAGTEALQRESAAIVRQFGNHPSFVATGLENRE